ncbi:hypothetical protein P152DRAFT_455501 [Eremomyces bilateralis CBS 781.70]|uniref:Uncharacterized protein n=1 Tax=Eremomyces bilateralis CBS 781.70 TaxID=1392243 RepID=A0A6G1GCM3_9PEZI|nr:uncharacterized protein P152DRAFT_455501 [Eremomyces bilateralis CBS 781.70]KAF1815784.1 hypothetical protein P152DRAFT_455501 [Eremomyces bilateralis CBS 781.70]
MRFKEHLNFEVEVGPLREVQSRRNCSLLHSPGLLIISNRLKRVDGFRIAIRGCSMASRSTASR